MWWTYALGSTLFAALPAVLAKIGIKGVNPDFETAIRTVVILGVAWGLVFARGGQAGLPGLRRQNWTFLVSSGLATGASWMLYFRDVQLGKVSQVALIDKLSVAIAIGLSVVFQGEVLTWKTALGAALVIGGTIILIP